MLSALYLLSEGHREDHRRKTEAEELGKDGRASYQYDFGFYSPLDPARPRQKPEGSSMLGSTTPGSYTSCNSSSSSSSIGIVVCTRWILSCMTLFCSQDLCNSRKKYFSMSGGHLVHRETFTFFRQMLLQPCSSPLEILSNNTCN
jgi:hypothetical protein